jgi:hypothetical protein
MLVRDPNARMLLEQLQPGRTGNHGSPDKDPRHAFVPVSVTRTPGDECP